MPQHNLKIKENPTIYFMSHKLIKELFSKFVKLDVLGRQTYLGVLIRVYYRRSTNKRSVLRKTIWPLTVKT